LNKSYRLLAEVQNISDICRFISTISLGRKMKSLFIIAKKHNNYYIYSTALNIYLFSGKADLLILYAKSDEKPKRYIRYVDAPIEKYEWRDTMINPVGLYLPVIELNKLPKILDPLITEVVLSSDLGMVINTDDESIIENSKTLIEVMELGFSDFARLTLERKDINSISFSIPINNQSIYIAFGEPIRINNNLYGNIYITKGPHKDKGFFSVNEAGEVIWFNGKKDPALAYASVIHVKKLSNSFHQFISSVANLY